MAALHSAAVRIDELETESSVDSEWTGHQGNKHALQNFVTEYVRSRLHMHGGYCPQFPEPPSFLTYQNELLRKVALIFEEKHAVELRNMVVALCQQRNLSFQRYVEVVEYFARNDNESSAQMSYGRLVALVAFAGLVATHLSDVHLYPEITMIVTYTSKFLEKRIALTWPQDERSWDKFFDLAKTIIKMNDADKKEQQSEAKHEFSGWWPSVRALAIFGILGFGAFTLMRSMLRAR